MAKSNAGRKSKYESHVEPRLGTIGAWARKGYTQEKICERLGVHPATFCKYKTANSELRKALKAGLDDSVSVVETSLFKNATGFKYTEDVVIGKGDNAHVQTLNKYQPPNIIAQIFYLKNRASGEWRDRIDQAVMNPDGSAINQSSMVVIYNIPDNNREIPAQANPRLATIQKAIDAPGGNGNGNGNGS
jgi:hypothetical protein